MENIIEIDGKKYKQTFTALEPAIPAKPKKIELERFVFEDVELKVRKVNPPKGLIVHFHAGHRDGRNNSLNCPKKRQNKQRAAVILWPRLALWNSPQ